jgi:hypothetical protein
MRMFTSTTRYPTHEDLLEYFMHMTEIHVDIIVYFGFESNIKNHASPEEVFAEFYPMQLSCYQKRKVGYIYNMPVCIKH